MTFKSRSEGPELIELLARNYPLLRAVQNFKYANSECNLGATIEHSLGRTLTIKYWQWDSRYTPKLVQAFNSYNFFLRSSSSMIMLLRWI